MFRVYPSGRHIVYPSMPHCTSILAYTTVPLLCSVHSPDTTAGSSEWVVEPCCLSCVSHCMVAYSLSNLGPSHVRVSVCCSSVTLAHATCFYSFTLVIGTCQEINSCSRPLLQMKEGVSFQRSMNPIFQKKKGTYIARSPTQDGMCCSAKVGWWDIICTCNLL